MAWSSLEFGISTSYIAMSQNLRDDFDIITGCAYTGDKFPVVPGRPQIRAFIVIRQMVRCISGLESSCKSFLYTALPQGEASSRGNIRRPAEGFPPRPAIYFSHTYHPSIHGRGNRFPSIPDDIRMASLSKSMYVLYRSHWSKTFLRLHNRRENMRIPLYSLCNCIVTEGTCNYHACVGSSVALGRFLPTCAL